MANKKSKTGKKSGGKVPPNNQPKPNKVEPPLLPPPQERIDAVRPFWESQSQPQRVGLLTVDLENLRQRARTQTEAARQAAVAEVDAEHLDMLTMGLEPSMEEVLDEGVARLKNRSTWKLWTWPVDQKEFIDAEAFRQHVVERHVREELRKYLPRDDPKTPERPAEESFRKRMTDLLTRVQQQNQRQYEEMAARQAGLGGEKRRKQTEKEREREQREREKQEREKQEKQEASDKDKDSKDSKEKDAAAENNKESAAGTDGKPADGPVLIYRRRRHHAADAATIARDTNIELINIMLEALEQEHEVLYQSLLMPIINFVMEALSEDVRETSKLELAYEDFDKMQPDDVAHIMEWLTEKVDALSTKLKADIKEEEEPEDEENMGDVDLWSLTEQQDGLTVNSKWLQHLQERLLGEDGHPRKVKQGEDPHSNGLVLEWVYGTIVSTAEKARDGSKRMLGSYLPQPNEAHHALLRALEEQYVWDSRLSQARSLLGEMLKSRLEAKELAEKYDIKPVPKNAKPEELPAEDALPNHVIVAMLKREVLLTRAKLHYLLWEHLTLERQLRTWKNQLKQGEPEFERLKRELEEVKHSHRGLDSTYRSQAEMERHRAQLADAAIEEQLEVQTAFREQGALLQNIYDRKQRSEYDLARKETEIKQLQGWKATVENLIEKFNDIFASKQAAAAEQKQQQSAMSRPASENALAAADAAAPVTADGIASAAAISVDGDQSSTTAAAAEATNTAVSDAATLDAVTSPRDVEEGNPAASPRADSEAVSADKQANGWMDKEPASDDNSPTAGLSPDKYMQLVKLRNHVHKDVRKQLYSDADDKTFFDNLKNEVKAIERRMEEARVVIQHLEMQLVNVGCDDPGIALGTQLLLPLLQERLDAQAKQFAADRAKMAESEIIRMEMEQAARQAAEREKKRAAKAAKKDRVKSEKEKERADKEAREAAEVFKKQQEEEARKQKEEEDRRKRQEQLEALRKAEEEFMEQRRRELLSDENGYWRQRMRMEEQAAAAAAVLENLADGVNDTEALTAAVGNHNNHNHQRAPQDMSDNHRRRGNGYQTAHRRDEHQQVPDKTDHNKTRTGAQGNFEKDSRAGMDQTSRDRFKRHQQPIANGNVEVPHKPIPAPPARPNVASSNSQESASVKMPASAATNASAVPEPPAREPVRSPSPTLDSPAAQSAADKPTVNAVATATEVKQVAVQHAVPAPKSDSASPAPIAAAKTEVASTPAPAPALYFGAVPVTVDASAVPPPPPPPPAKAQAAQQNGNADGDASSQHAEQASQQPKAAPTAANPASPQVAPPPPPPGQPPAASPAPNAVSMLPPQAHHAAPYTPQVPVQSAPAIANGPRAPSSTVQHPIAPVPVVVAQNVMSSPPGIRQAVPAPALVPTARPAPHVIPNTGAPNMAQNAHPAARIPVQVPIMPVHAHPHAHAHFGPHMAAPPGSVVVPGPNGQPIYVFANNSTATMAPQPGAHMMPMPHTMAPMQGVSMHTHGVINQSPVVGAPNHATPQMANQAPATPQITAAVTSAPIPTANKDRQQESDSKPPSSSNSSTVLLTSTSVSNDKSLNVAAKPFVPSVIKPTIVVPPVPAQPPVQQQNLHSPPAMNGGPVPFPMHVVGQPHGMPHHAGQPHNYQQIQPAYHQGVRGPQPPMMQQQPGMQGPVQGGKHDKRGPRQLQPGAMQPPHGMPQQPMPPPQQPYMVMPNGMPVDPRMAGHLPMMMHPMQQHMQHMGVPPPMQLHSMAHGQAMPVHGMSHMPAGPNAIQGQLVHPHQQYQHQQPHQQMPQQGYTPVPSQHSATTNPVPVPVSKSATIKDSGPLPLSPDGPLASSQNSDNSTANSEENAGAQQRSTAAEQQPVASQPQTQQPAVAAEAHKEQQQTEEPVRQSDSVEQGSSLHASSSQTSGVATTETTAKQATNQQTPQSETTVKQAVSSSQVQQQQPVQASQAVTPSPPAPRSWSAIAAKDKTVEAATQSAPRNQAATTAPSQANQQPASSNASNVSWRNMLQHTITAQQQQQQQQSQSAQQPAPVKWAGTPPVGNFLAVPAMQLSGARLTVGEAGAVMYEAPNKQPRSLQLIRGLRNGEGEYNCFLNVIIQSLWHLRPFREALLALTQATTEQGAGSLKADRQVLQALTGIFHAMTEQPAVSAASQAPAEGAQPPAVPLQGRTVSPAALRDALAALDHGQGAARVQKSDMHDAAEVLGTILECLHRAEACTGAANGPQPHDITLPQRVKQSAAGKPVTPASTVHRLFGLDVQVACAPETPKDQEDGNKKMTRNQRSSGHLAGMHAGNAAASQQTANPPAPEFLQFTKFFHLVPAQGLRQALGDAMLPSGAAGCSWEELLVATEAAGNSTAARDADGKPLPVSTLLRRPRVFTLAVVWESPQVPPEAIKGTLAALGPAIELPAVFRIPAAAVSTWPKGSGSTYTLRAVVCYFGHHYLAFVLSEELDLWLCFDDADISLVGRWPDVCRAMLGRRMQPSLLIYEDVSVPA